jgi:hypothetical protein
VDAAPVVVIVGLAIVSLVAIIVAPFRRVRAERPLPSDVEARVLLGEPPDQIDAETDAPPPPRRRQQTGPRPVPPAS